MQESDTYWMIFEEGQLIQARKNILIVGEEMLGPADEAVKVRLSALTDLERLDRMLLQALEAVSWQEVLDTP